MQHWSLTIIINTEFVLIMVTHIIEQIITLIMVITDKKKNGFIKYEYKVPRWRNTRRRTWFHKDDKRTTEKKMICTH